jgi:RND family efflux transporter MFP subunit
MKHLLPFLILLTACGKHEVKTTSTPDNRPTVKVQTQKVATKTMQAFEDVVGTVRSRQRAQVEAKVSGRILDYLATPGQVVKKGDLLARLDVQEIDAKVAQAKASLDQAKKEMERYTQLLAASAATKQEFDNAEARLKIATAAVSEAETMLSYASVTVPFDGVITRKLAEVGDLAMPGKPLVEIEAPTNLRFEADLPEAILERIKLGAKMKVKIASISAPLEGTVSEIAPIADAVSRTFQVKFDLPQTEGLRTGQFGRVSVPVADAQSLTVPTAAVIKRGQMEIVFVAASDHAQLRLVKTGKMVGGDTEILSGLEEGEAVIINGITRLEDGQPVTIQP